jgi:group I intron endonuclease
MDTRWTIYCHTHVESGRRYIGLTKKTILQRWNNHVLNAHKKTGKGCRYFWSAIRKYGKDAFSHEVLEYCSTLEVANQAEEAWVEFYETRNQEKGFNLAKGGSYAPSPESLNVGKKISAAVTGRRMSEECKAHLSRIRTGSKHSPETRQKLDAIKQSTQWRERQSASHRGKVTSEETKARIRASNKSGDPEVRSRIAASVSSSFGENRHSRHPGVTFHRGQGKWTAYVRRDGKTVHLGCFVTEDEAIKARQNAHP